MSQQVVLEVKGLEKKFGKFTALKNVAFTLHPGEVLGFIGPNGAGKSTTIRSILGLIKPNSGQVKVFGCDAWTEAAKIHQRLAYVPGDVTFWPNLTGGQTIDLLLRLSGQEHSQQTDQLIAAFKLDPNKKNRSYSKGNRQKVALIAAFSTEADLYIFDEPTSGLDPLNELVFQKRIAELKQRGKSVLLSSHILSEVERMCDNVVIIREGVVIESGSLAEMRHLTRTNVAVKTHAPLTELTKQPGVHQAELANDQRSAKFSVDAEQLGAVITWLSAKEIVSLTTAPPTLEDLFMRYYQADKGGE
ncbi:ABC transporter ATP-binding protein [Ligilactobacillus salitolerans]|uniref:ABC transporter ATP-binding protein n=1 Tax=Ligilactobacillus salitolerans TaxID=1808352 RepID=A0A401ITC4_9LACO|nr:ABC transporter ATP-binding protein [Ligilactobacillus salitolerans]GBG94755.1 ABC transporter ATP-binding protein [Ligilactobacillus salitolerans]